MLTLRYSTTSPFVRKVSATLIEVGADEEVSKAATNPWAADTDLPNDNPLGKVPALITESGEVLYDSPVICEYLDCRYGSGRLFPPAGEKRWAALRLQAIGDGIMEAAVSRILESRRPPELQSESVAERAKGAIERALDALEREAGDLADEFTIGHLTIACALEYLDFRFSAENWRAGRPRLTQWHEAAASRPSIQQTIPRES